MRSQRGQFTDERAATFLVLDRAFPRSVVFALRSAEQCLQSLAPESQRMGVSDEAKRQLGRIRTSLEYRQTPEILDDLPAQMQRVQRAVMAANAAVRTRYFQATPTTTWTEELV